MHGKVKKGMSGDGKLAYSIIKVFEESTDVTGNGELSKRFSNDNKYVLTVKETRSPRNVCKKRCKIDCVWSKKKGLAPSSRESKQQKKK